MDIAIAIPSPRLSSYDTMNPRNSSRPSVVSLLGSFPRSKGLGRPRTRLHPLGAGPDSDTAVVRLTGIVSTVVLPAVGVPGTTVAGTLGTLAGTADTLDVAGTLGTAGVGGIVVGTAPLSLVAAASTIFVDGR